MAINTFAEHDEPDPDRDDTVLRAQASAALEQWMQDHPAVVGEIKETVRAHLHLEELDGRTREADRAVKEAEHRRGTLATKLDPGGHRIFGFTLGAALVAVLVVLDAIPLNWAAQAFGLDTAGTWLVTFILVIASLGGNAGPGGDPQSPETARSLGCRDDGGISGAAGAPHRISDHGGRRIFPHSGPPGRHGDGHIGWAGPLRFSDHSPDPAAEPVPRPPRDAACAPSRGGRPCRAEPGGREAAASHRRTPPDAPPVGFGLAGAGERRPRSVGSGAGAGYPGPISGVVIGYDFPLPADTKTHCPVKLAKTAVDGVEL